MGVKAGIAIRVAVRRVNLPLVLAMKGPLGDSLIKVIHEDFERQLNAGLLPPIKGATARKTKRRSRKPWDTLARRLWTSLTEKTADSLIIKSVHGVIVGTKIPYHAYQSRMGRDVYISPGAVDIILLLINRAAFGLMPGGPRFIATEDFLRHSRDPFKLASLARKTPSLGQGPVEIGDIRPGTRFQWDEIE